jgi:hypothetical protein
MSRLSPDEDLLTDLNEIIDFCVGNEKPQDVSFNERTTLPEILSYCELYPKNIQAVRDAKHKTQELLHKVTILLDKIKIMDTKIMVKLKKY